MERFDVRLTLQTEVGYTKGAVVQLGDHLEGDGNDLLKRKPEAGSRKPMTSATSSSRTRSNLHCVLVCIFVLLLVAIGLAACGGSSAKASGTASATASRTTTQPCASALRFSRDHPSTVAFAQAHSDLVTALLAHWNLVSKIDSNPSSSNLTALKQEIGTANLNTLMANQSAVSTLITPYRAQLECVAGWAGSGSANSTTVSASGEQPTTTEPPSSDQSNPRSLSANTVCSYLSLSELTTVLNIGVTQIWPADLDGGSIDPNRPSSQPTCSWSGPSIPPGAQYVTNDAVTLQLSLDGLTQVPHDCGPNQTLGAIERADQDVAPKGGCIVSARGGGFAVVGGSRGAEIIFIAQTPGVGAQEVLSLWSRVARRL
jgi:hypothetical protein